MKRKKYFGVFVKGHKINLGRKCSEEKKEKISETEKEQYRHGRVNPFKGKKRPKEYIEKQVKTWREKYDKGEIKMWHKGKKFPEESKRNLPRGEGKWNWKGDRVKKSALHVWIRRNKPKPKKCEVCNKNPPRDLSNISGEYKRDINDFDWLCVSCHSKRDKKILNIKKMKEIFK